VLKLKIVVIAGLDPATQGRIKNASAVTLGWPAMTMFVVRYKASKRAIASYLCIFV
jgi:hypothetical protein